MGTVESSQLFLQQQILEDAGKGPNISRFIQHLNITTEIGPAQICM